MPGIAPGRILVGIDPCGDHEAALEYAAVHAARRGWGIHLVLVQRPRWPGPDGLVEVVLVGDDLMRVDLTHLDRCEERLAYWTHGEVPVTRHIAHGAVGPALDSAAADCDLVVLQHHRMARPWHIPTLSVTNHVASRARVPVLAVPDGWHEADDHPDAMLAAVEDAETSWAVAEVAFEEAAVSGCGVRLMRAWSYADDLEPDDPALRHFSADDWTRVMHKSLATDLGPLLADWPDIPCEIAVEHGQATHVLVLASAGARLLVIGRHEPALSIGSHLGPVTRAVLTHARCPVLVVDAHRPGPRPGS